MKGVFHPRLCSLKQVEGYELILVLFYSIYMNKNFVLRDYLGTLTNFESSTQI